ncbi:MAG TPA: NAD-dependent epimerase/dehydratase family protein, partial [Terriglobales bacterium]
MKNGFWRDRSVFITGATGLVGGWLTKHLLDQGAHITALVRDWVPASEFVHAGFTDRVNVVRGGLASPYLLERVLGEYEVEVVFHLAAQTIVGIANRNPLSTFESNVRGTWNLLEACRRS